MNKTNLSDYIKARQIDFKIIEEELSFLEKITLPLSMTVHYTNNKEQDTEMRFYSEDYTLATDVKLKKGTNFMGGQSYPDGWYDKTNNNIYPQFYFILETNYQNKKMPILIQHKGFETDSNIILYSYDITDGGGDYKDMKGQRVENRVNRNNVYVYFENLGVKKELIETLKEKFEEYYKMMC